VLLRNTEQALAQGVFQTPSFVVGDELFVGSDRLDFVEAALLGEQGVRPSQT
jgi:2-hydroxychromene-2-carboxylate isomerase